MKTLDLSKSVYELTQEYPEVVDIMAALGFIDITKKAMLLSVGRMMTIPKGAKMKGIPMEKIVAAFHEKGFEISSESGLNHNQNEKNGEEEEASRTEQLKAYLRRLGEGEDLESVRKDFVDQFGEVDAHEIMDAEQQLMAEGTPLEEVQRLCDVHSALFHGATSCETHAAPEGGNMFTAMMLAGIEGHPLHTFTKENEAIQRELDSWKKDHSRETFVRLRDVSIHYAKKGDLIYPLLKTKYDITGPQNVMWTVDDEIRDEMGALVREWDNARAEAVLARAEEMIYKEANILFPICAEHFTDEEWQGIYRDSKDYAPCLGVENKMWNDAEKSQQLTVNSQQLDEVRMPGGHLTLPPCSTPSRWKSVLSTPTTSTASSTRARKSSSAPVWPSTARSSSAIRRKWSPWCAASSTASAVAKPTVCPYGWTREAAQCSSPTSPSATPTAPTSAPSS